MSDGTVLLSHGSGGVQSQELIEQIFVRHLGNATLDGMEDSAVVDAPEGGRIALTTDSFVVQPLFFPGGDIGKLSVCGTVNDLSMRGARPVYLTSGFIIEEGFPLAQLERIVASQAATAQAAGVRVVAGDTKVVERGKGDGVFINTAGVGVLPQGIDISAGNAQVGDVVLVNGAVGDHGLAIMTLREGLAFSSPLRSDCAPLNDLVASMLAACPAIHVLRDPTRGGLATTLNELAQRSRVGIEIEESQVPVHTEVAAAAELLGLDPLYSANEGKLIAIVPEAEAPALLRAMRSHPLGAEAAVIGRVTETYPGTVILRTLLGTRRVLDMLSGEQLPRIC
ncbi:MAG: hydrogenase expression/formation protein HypE [Anaerolineae bacterium]|jgi:hydrogenase expression/formation protein HypE|nr:hydrogenase expression/formation protein HypE [Chloroflexota bacterium]